MENEKTINFRTRAANLTPDSPYSTWRALLVHLIDLLRGDSLETSACVETQTDRDSRRVRINEAKEHLLCLLVDPAELDAEYRERQRQEQEFNHQ
jgi:hypothetical protein